jgi:hypothetical protein
VGATWLDGTIASAVDVVWRTNDLDQERYEPSGGIGIQDPRPTSFRRRRPAVI